MSTEPASGWEYAVEYTPGHGRMHVTKVLSSEPRAEETALALRRVQLVLRPTATPDAVVVRRRPGGKWELRPQDQLPLFLQMSGRRRLSACRAHLRPLMLPRAARGRSQRAPRSEGQSAGPLTPADGQVPLTPLARYLHRLMLRIRLRMAWRADLAIQLMRWQRGRTAALEALRKRSPHADDDQTTP